MSLGDDVEKVKSDMPLYKKTTVTKEECEKHLNSFPFKAKDQSLFCFFRLTRTQIRKSALACEGK